MPKICYLITLFIVVLSCKENNIAVEAEQDSNWESVASELPRKIALNPKSKALVDDWAAFKSFDTSFDRIYTATYIEDLVLIVEDLVENQKALEGSEYPTEFDIPQIKGRQNVLKTFILKAKGDLEYRQDPKVSIEEMIAAYNGFRNQFNVQVNNTLPEELMANDKN